jgi:hypothetical protein
MVPQNHPLDSLKTQIFVGSRQRKPFTERLRNQPDTGPPEREDRKQRPLGLVREIRIVRPARMNGGAARDARRVFFEAILTGSSPGELSREVELFLASVAVA